MGNRKITIQDVAHFAGVGKTSVSRYLNGELTILSEEIRQKIAQAIDSLNYQLSQIARSMKRGKTKLIALILADIRNPYSIELIRGVEKASQAHDYTLLVLNADNEITQEQRILQSLVSYQVEGIISQALSTQDRNFSRLRLPIVSVDRCIHGLDCDVVGLDNEQAAEAVVRHLMDMQFKSLLFITEKIQGIAPREIRVRVFERLLQGQQDCLGKVVELNSIENSSILDKVISEFYGSQSAVKKAIISVNGITTLNIALALHRLNLNCGKDIGLIGFDDPVWAAVVSNGITAMRQPTYEMGYTACELLLARIQGDQTEAKSLLYPGELVIRRSTQFQ